MANGSRKPATGLVKALGETFSDVEAIKRVLIDAGLTTREVLEDLSDEIFKKAEEDR